jgi:hypothetical protein
MQVSSEGVGKTLGDLAEVLTKQTGLKWEVNGGTLRTVRTVSATSAEIGQKMVDTALKTHGIQAAFMSFGPQKNLVNVQIDISDPRHLTELALKNKVLKSPQQMAHQPISQKERQSAARYLEQFSGTWKVTEQGLSCSLDEKGSPRQAVFDLVTELQDCVDVLEVEFRRKTTDGQRQYEISIQNEQLIKRLARLSTPPRILLNEEGYKRSLASIALRLCYVTGSYSAEALRGDNPEREMPFPLVSLSKEGLRISLPEELARNPAVVDSFEKATRSKVKPLKQPETKFSRTFVSEIVVPLKYVPKFVMNRLGFPGDTLADMATVSGVPLWPIRQP